MMNIYEIAYDMVLDLRQEIVPALRMEMGEPDSRCVNALSATYILQDYLAERIAVLGESPVGEDTDGITWERIREVLEGWTNGG